MVCGSQDDLIVDRAALEAWQTYFKEGDRLWECVYGHHFFHYYQPQPVGRQILKFWQSLSPLEMTFDISQSYL